MRVGSLFLNSVIAFGFKTVMSVGHVEKLKYSVLLRDGKRNSRTINVCRIHIVEVGVLILFLPFYLFINGL